MEKIQPPDSPHWGSTAKLVVSLTVVIILGALLARFQAIIGPVLMAFVLAYLLHPLISFLEKRLHFGGNPMSQIGRLLHWLSPRKYEKRWAFTFRPSGMEIHLAIVKP